MLMLCSSEGPDVLLFKFMSLCVCNTRKYPYPVFDMAGAALDFRLVLGGSRASVDSGSVLVRLARLLIEGS